MTVPIRPDEVAAKASEGNHFAVAAAPVVYASDAIGHGSLDGARHSSNAGCGLPFNVTPPKHPRQFRGVHVALKAALEHHAGLRVRDASVSGH